jgi:hypothetical protein
MLSYVWLAPVREVGLFPRLSQRLPAWYHVEANQPANNFFHQPVTSTVFRFILHCALWNFMHILIHVFSLYNAWNKLC